ncbi:EF-hand domain-containing family member C2 [Callorhinchus milii]|uniref:EF-hand domain-containing family member C2 n=2 Tax=Callorhinchus milii TaxID=7868 RepID=A0A4W3IIR8_CALMI|nr:EF-hand domain-containing family member C2 [Callorhinchus milii]|eukprot:gi/632937493/ref/XP_007899859.1/ PREDICTED: EF-hand domain-containing family member C2 [Callorhinchus milii]
MTLPLLPGNTFNRNLGKEKFHKSHHFDFPNGVPTIVGDEKPGIGGEPLVGQKLKIRHSVFPKGQGTDAPAWVAFDKQVLNFQAYFQEAVQEKREERYRIRKVKIYFYLEDDTIQVIEPEVKNSGIPQGTLIRRHRIPLPFPNEDMYYTVDHFNINQEIVFYSRTFMITDCDAFTKNFLRKMGARVNPPACVPEDPYNEKREELRKNMQPLRPYEKLDTLRQFLDHDTHVLRFYGYWDDSETMFGDLRELVLHYYLADDTIEIREVILPNSGRDAVSIFLHRSRLPKHVPERLPHPGEITDHTILNVFGQMGHAGRYILDGLKTGAVYQEMYKDSDLMIGAVINVWGRKVVICDCDEFTKEYYRNKYGIAEFTPIKIKSKEGPKIEKEIAPYTGFGSEEDSLNSTLKMVPHVQRNMLKFMENDRQGLDGNVLRFSARMVLDSNPINSERKFVISYFLNDDTMSIFEPPISNSGVVGGKFLERGKIKKPNQELFKSEPSQYFTVHDLFIGAKLCLNGHSFLLVDADEYTLCYMEKHADEFLKGNICSILSKLKTINNDKSLEIKRMFAAQDFGSCGIIRYDQFRDILLEIAQEHFTPHEIMTICRYYSIREQPGSDLCVVLALVQEQLRKHPFEDFTKLTQAFTFEDQQRTGLLSTKESRNILKSFHLPLSKDLIEELLSKFKDAEGRVQYTNLISSMNWREYPLPASEVAQYPSKGWNGEPPTQPVKVINYIALIEDLFGKQE